MARDPKHDHPVSADQDRAQDPANRFYQVPHCIGAARIGPGSRPPIARSRPRAAGPALTPNIVDSSESDDTHRLSARIWDAGDVRNLRAMTDHIHSFNSLAVSSSGMAPRMRRT